MLEVEVNFKSRIICREFGVTIGEVAAKATIATSAIRYYERKKMAREKIHELDVALAKTKAMRDMLEAMTSCRCRKLEQCAEGLERNRQRWHLSASPKPHTKPR
jgi:AcrR family transcriptional regulator